MPYSCREIRWKGDKLFVIGKRAPLAEIVRDSRYPTMWRSRLLPDGELSDMVNLTRAKDSAAALVIFLLNSRHRDAAWPPLEQTAPLVPGQAPDPANAWVAFPPSSDAHG